MQELLTPQQTEELISGRLYIMDYTDGERGQEPVSQPPGEPADKPSDRPAEEAAELSADISEQPVYERAAHTSRRFERRPYALLAAAAGVLGGVVIALFFPISGGDFLSGVAASAEGGFAAALFRRLGQVGAFLLVEFLLGYFAAGGAVAWIVPLVCGLSSGLTSAGVIAAGGSAWVILPELLYTVIITAAANTSAELSALLLRLVSGESSSVVTRGRVSRGYDLQYAVYLLLILAVAVIEAAVKTI